VPAEAVIRVPQMLSGITGRKASVGGSVSSSLNSLAQPKKCEENCRALRVQEVGGTHGVGVKSVDTVGNTESEGSQLVHP